MEISRAGIGRTHCQRHRARDASGCIDSTVQESSMNTRRLKGCAQLLSKAGGHHVQLRSRVQKYRDRIPKAVARRIQQVRKGAAWTSQGCQALWQRRVSGRQSTLNLSKDAIRSRRCCVVTHAGSIAWQDVGQVGAGHSNYHRPTSRAKINPAVCCRGRKQMLPGRILANQVEVLQQQWPPSARGPSWQHKQPKQGGVQRALLQEVLQEAQHISVGRGAVDTFISQISLQKGVLRTAEFGQLGICTTNIISSIECETPLLRARRPASSSSPVAI